ncbi:MAG: NUDIX domain-containing protein [Phycisphaerales bacterium]
MTDDARLVRLRRPPQLVRIAERFVPRVPLDAVERRWDALRAANLRYFDGDILHVLGQSRNGYGGVTIHVAVTSYRFYAVQRPGLDGSGGGPIDCGVRPLGAKGITRCDGKFAMARRSESVAFYPHEWEFVPGGGLEPDDDAASCVLRELQEETGLEAIGAPIAVGLLFDPGALSWEVVHHIEARSIAGRAFVSPAAAHAWEHGDRRLIAPGAWPEPMCPIARTMLELLPDDLGPRGASDR